MNGLQPQLAGAGSIAQEELLTIQGGVRKLVSK
jgi:hypothetical protein